MAREELKTRLPLLTSDDLIKLAYDLRNLGFNIDTRHYIDAHRVEDILLGLELKGDLAGPERLKTVLAPVFCSTSEEQTTFYAYFDSWLAKHTRIKERFKEADSQVKYRHGLQTESKNIFTRYKWWFLGITLFVLVLGIAGYFHFTPIEIIQPRQPKTWFQGKVFDYQTSLPIVGARVDFLNQTIQTDSLGRFVFEEFAKDTIGTLILSHPNYLAKIFLDRRTTTKKDTSTWQLYPVLKKTQHVSVVVIEENSKQPIPNARITFLASNKQTDNLGRVTFAYQPKDTSIDISVSQKNYYDETIPYRLHGFDESPLTITLEQKSTPEADSLKALIARINNVKLADEPGKLQIFYKAHYEKIRLGSIILPFLFLLAWLLVRWYHKPLMLERETTRGTPSYHYVIVEWLAEFIFKNAKFRRTIQQFRQHRESSATELDQDFTVDRTIKNGGFFTPAYRSRFVLPEYLVLIDRASFDDQQAKFVDELINRFTRDGVYVDRYYFRRDPRVCSPEKTTNVRKH